MKKVLVIEDKNLKLLIQQIWDSANFKEAFEVITAHGPGDLLASFQAKMTYEPDGQIPDQICYAAWVPQEAVELMKKIDWAPGTAGYGLSLRKVHVLILTSTDVGSEVKK